MNKAETSVTWFSESDANFSDKVKLIIKGCKGNEHFRSVADLVNSVDAQFKVYSDTLVDKSYRNTITGDERKKQRGILEDLLRQLGADLTAAAKGDLEKLRTTSFPLVALPGEAGDPKIPTEIKVFVTGNGTVLMAMCAAQANAEIYMAQVSRDMKAWDWNESSRNATVLISDLPLGERLYLRMRMRNVNGTSGWSNIVPFRIPETDEQIPKFRKLRRRKALS